MTQLLHSHPKVGIIGGTQGTGAQFARRLQAQGFAVQVSGEATQGLNQELAQDSDLLIFAPPLAKAEQIIASCIGACTRQDQLVLDLCSLKAGPMEAMAPAPGHVIGLHPLFGPHFDDFCGQDLVLCPDTRTAKEQGQACQGALVALLKSWGLRVHVMDASEHDRLMATIQVIPHLQALVSGSLFRRLKIDAAQSLKVCSPVYKTELYMMGRIHSQNPALYASIIGKNPHSAEVARALQEILAQLGAAIDTQDVQGLCAAFAANQEHLGSFAQTALLESQRLLQAAYGRGARKEEAEPGEFATVSRGRQDPQPEPLSQGQAKRAGQAQG